MQNGPALRFARDHHRYRSLSLPAYARLFWKYLSPRLLAVFLLSTLLARLVIGQWHLVDLVVVVTILAVYPLSEWIIHVFLLHYKPKHLFGLTLDLHVAREHRDHHADPSIVNKIFIPTKTLVIAAMLELLIVLLWGSPRAVTGLVTIAVLALSYEWTHFLIHSPYKPKTRLYRRLRRAHRWHHFRNEHYWFGVSTHVGDRIMGTFPDPNSIARTETCRRLAS